MADRDEQGPQSELVDALTGLLFLHIKTQSDLRPFAWDVVNGGIDLGGGRRIAIVERVPTADDPRDHREVPAARGTLFRRVVRSDNSGDAEHPSDQGEQP